jgi:formate--tetrahydrofolate ligase
MTDIEIARKAAPLELADLAQKLGIHPQELHPYGRNKAKLPLHLLDEHRVKQAHLILVTALSPTPAGEGKTTTSVGLTDGLAKIGKRAVAALREPSLGPVFGIKGGAAGGGHAQVIPMEDINLHFTGDFSAVEKANNLLAAMIDNDIQRRDGGVGLDPRTVLWKRVMDMNDRSLRNIITGGGGRNGGVLRETGFNITAASEIMAILCMASSEADFKERLGRIFIGTRRTDRSPVFASDIGAVDAMAILMREALMPNLVQTLEGNPAILHGGPFANIAQGTNSLLATKMAMSHADWVVTEAGFGADLGAEKFLNLKCRVGGIAPKAAVVVATVRALKYHGGVSLKNLETPQPDAVKKGLVNLEKHVENMRRFCLPVVVAINAFAGDADAEMQEIESACRHWGVPVERSEGWSRGGEGCMALAETVVKAAESQTAVLKHTYKLDDDLETKIHAVATGIYGADGVNFTNEARAALHGIQAAGLAHLPICMAKTQKSLSDNDQLIGRPTGFDITVRDFEVAAGAGFIVPLTGSMMRMPGLPATPAAVHMRLDPEGIIHGLS